MKSSIRKNLIRLKRVEEEIASRAKMDNLSRYNTGEVKHKKQLNFHRNLSKNRWVFGGNRSGKTECGAVECVYLARGIHPYRQNKPCSGWVVSLTREVQRDVAQSKILHYLRKDLIEKIVMVSGRRDDPENGIIDFILVKNVFGSLSKIGFKSCDQGREKFQGASLDFVWFDEEPPYDIYSECKMRVVDREGIIFGTMTPLKGLTWVYNLIYLNQKGDKDVWYEQMEWADNPFLSQNEVSSLTKTLSAEELDSRRYGRFASQGGMVYSEFDERVNVIEPFEVPKEWYLNISIDPGLHNPLSAHFYAQDYDGNVYVIAEHYAAEQTVAFHSAKIKQIAQRLGWQKDGSGNLRALIDSAALQKTLSSAKSVADLFFDEGIAVNTRVNKDLFFGISVVKKYLRSADGRSRLFIFKNCVNMIREIKSYFWGDGERPIKKDDHALDELRYLLVWLDGVPKRETKRNALQKDLCEAIRLNKRR